MDKKYEILGAAFKLFCVKGYDLSMSEIAKAVGIKPPSLYSHFESKEEIVELMIQNEISRYYSHLEKNMAEAELLSCREAMKSIYISVLKYFNEYERLRFWRTIPLIPNEHLQSICRSWISENEVIYNKKMKQCFDKGIEKGEIRSDVSESALFLYLAMIQGVLDGMLLYPRGTEKNVFAENVFNAYWEGICSKKG